MTKSFRIEGCRLLNLTRAAFRVRELSAHLEVGDRFDCNTGSGRFARFHVERVSRAADHVEIECIGPTDFTEQFLNFTVSTKPFPEHRSDLPTPADLKIQQEDVDFLKRWIEDWNLLHPLQQAVLASVSRRRQTAVEIAQELNVSVPDIEAALIGLGDFLRRDSSTGTIAVS